MPRHEMADSASAVRGLRGRGDRASQKRAAGPALIPEPWYLWIGTPLVAGRLLVLAGSRRFARAGANIHTFRRPDVLVTDDAFAFSRNPIYLGFAAAPLGFAI